MRSMRYSQVSFLDVVHPRESSKIESNCSFHMFPLGLEAASVVIFMGKREDFACRNEEKRKTRRQTTRGVFYNTSK